MAVDLDAEIGAVLESASQVEPNAHWGISVIHMHNGRNEIVYGADAHVPFPAYNLGVLAIDQALEAQIGQTPPIARERVQIGPESRVIGGTGMLQFFPDGYSLGIKDAWSAMLRESDPTAAKLIINQLGGVAKTNDLLVQIGLDLQVSKLESLGEGGFVYGETTANETARLMAAVLSIGSLSANALRQSHMSYGLRAKIDDRISLLNLSNPVALKYLAARGLARFGRHIQLSAKTADSLLAARRPWSLYPSIEGSENETGSRHNVALIGRFIIAALCEGYTEDLSYGPKHPAHKVHAALGETMLRYQAA